MRKCTRSPHNDRVVWRFSLLQPFPMLLRRSFSRAGFTCALLFGAASVAAPSPAQLLAQSAATTPQRTVTVNPFFLLAGWIQADYEQRINPTISLGGLVDYIEFDGRRYTSFEAKGRLYPSEKAMRGLSIGFAVGVTRVRFDSQDCYFDVVGGTCQSLVKKTTTSPTIGVDLGYQWLLGSSGRTAVAVGFGGRRLLASKASLLNTDRVMPTYRLGVGYAW